MSGIGQFTLYHSIARIGKGRGRNWGNERRAMADGKSDADGKKAKARAI